MEGTKILHSMAETRNGYETFRKKSVLISGTVQCGLRKTNKEKNHYGGNSYFYIEKWAFKIMCEVCYRAKRDKKEAT